jgi:hypothetical protein
VVEQPVRDPKVVGLNLAAAGTGQKFVEATRAMFNFDDIEFDIGCQSQFIFQFS